MKLLLQVILLLTCFQLNAQNAFISGVISDKNDASTLPSASIKLINGQDSSIYTISDLDGYYEFNNLKSGHYHLEVTFMGYNPYLSKDIELFNGKHISFNIELESNFESLEDITVTALNKSELNNNSTAVSGHAFNTQDTRKYPGTRNDPARMVANFAGIVSNDDSRNDIVVRGNSPSGTIYRIEGIDIPNPNHFAVKGTSGGPVNIINDKTLDNSDFFTSAFPAEYGNSISSVFDLKLRDGNNKVHQQTFQFGLMGLEAFVEGPLAKKNNGSYLASYRYSTLSIMQDIGIEIGTNSVAKYQDASFKITLPYKNNGAKISIFGLGGISSNEINLSDEEEFTSDIYSNHERDQLFKTNMAVIGLNVKKGLNNKSFIDFSLAYSHDQQTSEHQTVHRQTINNKYILDSITPKLYYAFYNDKALASFKYTAILKKNIVIKIGFNSTFTHYNYSDDFYIDQLKTWDNRVNAKGNSILLQPYTSINFQLNEKLKLITGWHLQYYSLNNDLSAAEPRLGIVYNTTKKSKLSLGIGIHSQSQPDYILLAQNNINGKYIQQNKNIGFSKSRHYVIGYDYAFNQNFHIKTEVYFQDLYDIPVTTYSSSFSMINQGAGFDRVFPGKLTNNGTGNNYGIELTLEKYFSKKYFFLINTSVYESKYKGSDGITRDTDYNTNWITNILVGKLWKINEKSVLNTGIKISGAGGKRYSPIDVSASDFAGDIIIEDDMKNELQFDNYFRMDFKVSYTINAKKTTHEIGIDIANITNRKNILRYTFSRSALNNGADPITAEYQLGLLPIFYYRIDL